MNNPLKLLHSKGSITYDPDKHNDVETLMAYILADMLYEVADEGGKNVRPDTHGLTFVPHECEEGYSELLYEAHKELLARVVKMYDPQGIHEPPAMIGNLDDEDEADKLEEATGIVGLYEGGDDE